MSTINQLSELFLKFPGIGPRQAKRFVHFLAKGDKQFTTDLAKMISVVTDEIKQCSSCRRLFEKHAQEVECSICRNINNKDDTLLMVVEKDTDFENVERTNSYNGKYFILGENLPLMELRERDQAILKQLFAKIQEKNIAEVILATGATTEGENNARYIKKILEPLVQKRGLKITQLGRGLSTGTELEYIDTDTMQNALEGRR